MSFILERIQRAESGSKEYFAVLDLPSVEVFAAPVGRGSTHPTPSIRFDHVSFQYGPDSASVLSNLNFTLPAKTTVALVGHSGAGKSTITNLILKFYEPTKGEIYLNDQAYSKLTHNDIRRHIALVFQENELFSTTIRENVAYGYKDPNEAEILNALKQANAYDFVMKLPKKLDAKVGERGVKLSGGQKQRIQIARAIMRHAPILILDEATSSLDSESESLIQDALDHLMQDKLVIIIAHRFSTLRNAQQILVIDQGRITAAGTPNELAQSPGIYSNLLRYQIEGNQKLLSQYELH